MAQISKEAACWTAHGAYEKGHRCRWTDRGARRTKEPPHVSQWKDERGLTREEEMVLGLIAANAQGQVRLHYDEEDPPVIDVLVVDRCAGNVELFKKVYKEQHGEEALLHKRVELEFGDPEPYMAAGVYFLLGEQSKLLCSFVSFASCAGSCSSLLCPLTSTTCMV